MDKPKIKREIKEILKKHPSHAIPKKQLKDPSVPNLVNLVTVWELADLVERVVDEEMSNAPNPVKVYIDEISPF